MSTHADTRNEHLLTLTSNDHMRHIFHALALSAALLGPLSSLQAQAPSGCGTPSAPSMKLLHAALTDPQYAGFRSTLNVTGLRIEHARPLVGAAAEPICGKLQSQLAAWPHNTTKTELRYYEVDGAYAVTAITFDPMVPQAGTASRVAVVRDGRILGVIVVRQ